MTRPALLSTSEAAKRIGVTEQTIRNWVARKQIRHVRLPSGRVRFHPEDVDAALVPVEPELDGVA